MHDRTHRKPLRLDSCGSTWTGWIFAPYGRATDFRLISPTGEHFTSGDLSELHALRLDVDYLRLRVRELETAADVVLLSVQDSAAIAAALLVLDRLSLLKPAFDRLHPIIDLRPDAARPVPTAHHIVRRLVG